MHVACSGWSAFHGDHAADRLAIAGDECPRGRVDARAPHPDDAPSRVGIERHRGGLGTQHRAQGRGHVLVHGHPLEPAHVAWLVQVHEDRLARLHGQLEAVLGIAAHDALVAA